MDIYIWLFLLLSGCCHGLAYQVDCPDICICHPEGQIICRHFYFTGPLSPYFFRVIRNASAQLEIHMDYNKITQVSRRAFENFSSLRTLNLNHNLIDTLHTQAFYGLKQLRFLDMQNNSISHLPIGLFAQQAQLVSLDVSQNRIVRIELETLTPLISLEQLALSDNPLICNHELALIHDWAGRRNVSDGHTPITCLMTPNSTTKVPWEYMYHVRAVFYGRRTTTTISALPVTSTLPSSPSSKLGRTSDPTEETVLITNNSLYKLTSVSLMPNASASPRVENMTNVTNRTMSTKVDRTIGIVTFVVVTTVAIILSVYLFVVCRRIQKRKRLKVMQYENASSVPPPGRGKELLCDNDDEEESYEYVDLGKESSTARYVNLNQENVS